MEDPTATVANNPAEPIQPPLKPIDEQVVIALNPAQMKTAQDQMKLVSNKKLAEATEELRELQENIDIARKAHWNTARLKNQIARAEKRVIYYTKFKEAVDNGYVMVPGFPMDVFAIRTTKVTPDRQTRTGVGARLSDEASDLPPVGEGEYVDSQPSSTSEWISSPRKDDPDHQYLLTKPDELKDVDFPFQLAKPVILSAVHQAMALKVFDEIGVLPARPNRSPRGQAGFISSARGADPMVIGRIKESVSGRGRKEANFFIAWFIDPKDI